MFNKFKDYISEMVIDVCVCVCACVCVCKLMYILVCKPIHAYRFVHEINRCAHTHAH